MMDVVKDLKRQAKILKKKFPDIPLMRIQHILAVNLCFSSWSELLKFYKKEDEK